MKVKYNPPADSQRACGRCKQASRWFGIGLRSFTCTSDSASSRIIRVVPRFIRPLIREEWAFLLEKMKGVFVCNEFFQESNLVGH